ncbi:MAG TPA: TPM domain-containing protein [Ramlibacter sp.]
MIFLRLLRHFCVFCVLSLLHVFAVAQNVLPVPQLTGHVIDQTGTLDAIQVKGLDDKLSAFEQAKGTQMVVLMVPTTQPEDDASYANRVANAWKIGRKGVGDGILVIVAKDDHKVRIEVAKTLEGAVPDLAAKEVIDDAMLPKFKQGDFAGGLQAGVDQLIARINGEPLPAPQPGRQSHPQRASGAGFDWVDLAIFLFIGVPIAGAILRGMFGRAFGSLVTGAGAGVIALMVTASLALAVVAAFIALVYTLLSGALGMMGPRRGPWVGPGPFIGGGFGRGGGFGGGGGWGSGGGGDFGGGGASGNW